MIKAKNNSKNTTLYNSILASAVASGSLEGINIPPDTAQKILQKVLIKIEKSA